MKGDLQRRLALTSLIPSAARILGVGEDLLRNKDAQGYLPPQQATIQLQPDYTQRARCQAKQRQAILWREALFDLVIE